MKLAVKLLGPILGVVTVGLLTATIWTYNLSSQALEESTVSLQKMAIANALKELEGGLSFNVLNAISLSQTGLFQPFLSNDQQKIAENLPGALARVRNMKKTYSYEMLGVLTPQGVVVAHTEDSMLGKSLAGEAFFKEALSGRVAISSPFMHNGKVVYNVAAPVNSPNGILGVVFNTSAISDTMSERMHLGEKGYLMVTDSAGLVFIHKERQNILQKNISREAWGKTMLASKRGNISFVYNGSDMTAFFDTLPDANWLVAAVVDDAEALAPVTAIRNSSALIAVVLLLVVAAVVFLVVRSILASINVGSDFAQQVADGNFTARWQSSSGDEIGGLAQKLNMAFEKVADQAQWYINILDSIPIYISVTDMNMRWTFANKAVLTAMGKARGSLMGTLAQGWGASKFADKGVGIAGLAQGISRSEFTDDNKTYDVTAAYLTDRTGKNIGHVEMTQDSSEQARLKSEANEAVRRGQLEAAARLEEVVSIISRVSGLLSEKIEQADNGARQVAKKMKDTADSMYNMSATVREVRSNAGVASSVAEATKDKALDGSRVVAQMVADIQKVQNKAQSLKTNMEDLGKQTEDIGEVLTVISDIADQTNLLALNAAIEAARAGDMGRGFAVVADEVRKLAEKTMQATNQVGTAIRTVQQSTRTNMENVDEAVAAIVSTAEQGRHSGESLKEIVGMSEDTTGKVHLINQATEDQETSAQLINSSIEQANIIASEVSNAMSNATQVMDELTQQAAVLESMIKTMKDV